MGVRDGAMGRLATGGLVWSLLWSLVWSLVPFGTAVDNKAEVTTEAFTVRPYIPTPGRLYAIKVLTLSTHLHIHTPGRLR